MVFAVSGQVYLTAATGPEAWGASGHDADSYDVTMTETNVGNSQHYIGTFHADYTPGDYRVTIYEQAGGAPADGDMAVAQGLMSWDGDEPITEYTNAVDGNKILFVTDETGTTLSVKIEVE